LNVILSSFIVEDLLIHFDKLHLELNLLNRMSRKEKPECRK